MSLPTDIDPADLVSFYYNPNTISNSVHFIGHIRNYNNTKDRDYLYKAHDIALAMHQKCPFDQVEIEDGKISESPSEVMYVLCVHLAELGMMPDYE
jgi:hypothetical protein